MAAGVNPIWLSSRSCNRVRDAPRHEHPGREGVNYFR